MIDTFEEWHLKFSNNIRAKVSNTFSPIFTRLTTLCKFLRVTLLRVYASFQTFNASISCCAYSSFITYKTHSVKKLSLCLCLSNKFYSKKKKIISGRTKRQKTSTSKLIISTLFKKLNLFLLQSLKGQTFNAWSN